MAAVNDGVPVVKLISQRSLAAVFTAVALAGCSTPPGDDPGSPPPTIPADAIAYDDIKSLKEREYPFTLDCSQITTDAAQQAGLAGTGEPIQTFGGPIGCKLDAPAESGLAAVRVEAVPPQQGEDRAFPGVWNGGSATYGYFRREILLDRYYSVRSFSLIIDHPECVVTVDTGSPAALKFVGELSEHERQPKTAEIRPSGEMADDIDKNRAAQFMDQYCPPVLRAAEALLQSSIDPDGGSLST